MIKRMIGVYLDGEERAALSQMAERDRRDMRDEAAVIIRDKLIECGLLPTDTPINPAPSINLQAVAHAEQR